jgi:hypothetical protein
MTAGFLFADFLMIDFILATVRNGTSQIPTKAGTMKARPAPGSDSKD